MDAGASNSSRSSGGAALGVVASGAIYAGMIALDHQDLGWALIIMLFVGPVAFAVYFGVFMAMQTLAEHRPGWAPALFLVGGAVLPLLAVLAVSVGPGSAAWRQTGLWHWAQQTLWFFLPVSAGGLVGGVQVLLRRRRAPA